MDDKPSVPSPTTLLRRYNLHPKKSWGQCFLHDRAILERIVDEASPTGADTVVEIGAGLGALTAHLAARAARVIAVERDRDLAEVLRRELCANPRVEVWEANALTIELAPLAPVLVVGNLPYNIASPLLFRLLAQRASIRSATLLLQLELAERLAAPPGSRTCGAPSVLLQRAAEVRLCFVVRRGAFVPRPRVDSALLHLTMRPPTQNDALVDEVVHAAFRFRRKTLRRALSGTYPAAAVHRALAEAEIDGDRRAETLAVAEYDALARALAQGVEGGNGRLERGAP
jgi:16S rRNA (adenine1518-N6/adenine1519-N6)-dimethyltransferase